MERAAGDVVVLPQGGLRGDGGGEDSSERARGASEGASDGRELERWGGAAHDVETSGAEREEWLVRLKTMMTRCESALQCHERLIGVL